MKSFLKNTILFLSLGCFFIVPGFYWVSSKIITPKAKKAVYIWGDSQMCQGIDISYLNAKEKYKFFSSAQHGAGVYDFLVFTELVPVNSTVIISNSRLVLIRPKSRDKNYSIINIPSLLALLRNNYSFRETALIAIKNLELHWHFYDKYSHYTNSDSIKKNPPLSAFEDLYNNKLEYLGDKENLYVEGLQKLKDKNCKIIALAFPYHSSITEIEKKSLLKADLEKFDTRVGDFFEEEKTLLLQDSVNIFYDRTHLNERGAQQVSEGLNQLPSKSTIINIVTGKKL